MDEQIPNERPAGPAPDTEGSMTRWIIAIFAMALLVLGGYKGYQWWTTEGDPSASAPTEAAPAAPIPEPMASSVALEAPASSSGSANSPAAEADLRAPAVVGDNIVNKCVQGGQVTYTNEPCPEGATVGTVDATAVDPNGVTGFTGDKAPLVTDRTALSDDPSRREAECHYLAAEITRMDYEFQQPLPPPVLDHLATNLKNAREQSTSLKCLDIPKATLAAKPASHSKVLEEKASKHDE